MRKSVFRDGNHLQDIRVEEILDFLQVDLGEIFASILLGGVVDEDIKGSVAITRVKPWLEVHIMSDNGPRTA